MRPHVRVIRSGLRSNTESTRELGESKRRVTRGIGESRTGKIEPGVGLIRSQVVAMPSVGMRRTTRLFGVVKGFDGARVLRSGRRLFPESGEFKVKKGNDVVDWIDGIVKNKNHSNSSAVKCTGKGWSNESKLKREAPAVQTVAPKKVKRERQNVDESSRDKMFGIVYTRKRKRLGVEKREGMENNKLCGIQFSRRQRRKTRAESEPSPVLSVVVESSCCSGFARFLNLVLRYVERADLRLSELANFLISEPLASAFASMGIRFLLGSSVTRRSGIFKFFEVTESGSLFSVDYSAIASCFSQMHLSMVFKVELLSPFRLNNPLVTDECDELSDSEVGQPCVQIQTPGNKIALHPSVRASKLAGRSTQYRNGLNGRGIQKRRSSLRRRRARNPALVSVRKPNGALVSDIISSRKNGIPFSSVVSKNTLGISTRSRTAANLKHKSYTMVKVTQSIDPSSCSANVLVIESDKCYRIEGASIMLEFSDLGEWVLGIKKDGLTRYTLLAQKIMRPCSSNRITHDIIWTGDENWKLEFPNRQDWSIFKDLYKKCSELNVLVSTPKTIPVPGVSEVFGYEDSNSNLFARPDAYISVKNDELNRALTKRGANYDMDSEDEEWLRKFNNEFCVEDDHDHLSEDKFELMVDIFEKTIYCSPEDLPDEGAAGNLCMDFSRREVVEAVYGYWIKKRKQRRSALLRVYQEHLAKKAPPIKPALRKKRSFKRQISHVGRGKQPSLLKSVTVEQDLQEEQKALLKVEEARSAANRSFESAIAKRSRAQMLMENANLTVYKAAMALKIAEGARVANSTEDAVTHILD